MSLTFNITPSNLINKHITIIYKTILPALLLFITVWFILGFRVRNDNTSNNKNQTVNNNKEPWVNYLNIPFGELRTGKDCPTVFYKRPEYRLPYRWPLGIRTSYPEEHIAPLMI